uniref:Beta-amyrin 28-oxidase-like n=1 Tax=Populus alba TaxID=43335 RepID=A0A4U5Q9H5_POPAL|nr:hypothetical protein D5086_0000117030 [Populus alba]
MGGARLAASAVVLLVLGVVFLGAGGGSLIAKACPLYCLDVDYMTCESSGDKKLNSACNCCLAPKNCTLHLADGRMIAGLTSVFASQSRTQAIHVRSQLLKIQPTTAFVKVVSQHFEEKGVLLDLAKLSVSYMDLLFPCFLHLSILCISLSLIVLLHKRKFWNTKFPPGKTGWPIIGETWDFMMASRCGTPEKFINDRVGKYSPEVFQTSLLGHNMAVFCGSGGNKFLYSSENKSVTGWLPNPIMKVLFSPEHASNSYKEESAKLRKFLPELLKPEPLQQYIPVMDSMAKDHLKADWFPYKQVKVFPLSKTYTFSLACRLFMNIKDPEHVSRLQNHFNLVTKGILSLPLNFPGTAYNRAIKGGNMIREEIVGIMKERRELISESNGPEFIDILTRMLLVTDENAMDDMEIADRVVGLLFGSHDTTSASISMAMYYLADNPHVYTKVLKGSSP